LLDNADAKNQPVEDQLGICNAYHSAQSGAGYEENPAISVPENQWLQSIFMIGPVDRIFSDREKSRATKFERRKEAHNMLSSVNPGDHLIFPNLRSIAFNVGPAIDAIISMLRMKLKVHVVQINDEISWPVVDVPECHVMLSLLRAFFAEQEQRSGVRANPKREELTSKYRGVSWDKTAKKWIVTFTYKKKVVYEGFYARSREADAARAYDRAVRKFAGPTHHINADRFSECKQPKITLTDESAYDDDKIPAGDDS
jgi:hypothetical protein